MFPFIPLLAFCSSDGFLDFVRKSVVDKNRTLFVFSKIANDEECWWLQLLLEFYSDDPNVQFSELPWKQ